MKQFTDVSLILIYWWDHRLRLGEKEESSLLTITIIGCMYLLLHEWASLCTSIVTHCDY